MSDFPEMRGYIGQQVRVFLTKPTGEEVGEVAVGLLLGLGEGGDVELQGEDGMVHYCWPALDMELIKCQDCGKPGPDVVKRHCPFAAEIHNERVVITACNACTRERAMDI